MSTYKRIDGDYVISTINSSDNVVINTHTVEINGNLDVEGNLTYINVTELNVKDPFILLNASNTGSYPSNSGVLTHKTVSDYAGIRFDNGVGAWQLSTSTDATGLTGTWANIDFGNVATLPGGSNTQIQFNDSSTFGASANLTFDKSTNKTTLQGHLALGNIGATPAATANAVTLYNKAVGGGDTGVYAVSASVNDELISRSRAFAYSLIL